MGVAPCSWSWWWSLHAQPAPQDGGSDPDDEQPRDERQPGVELLGHDEAREDERHEAEPEHAGGVGHRDRRAEEDGVARPAARSDQVPGDERLAVARA